MNEPHVFRGGRLNYNKHQTTRILLLILDPGEEPFFPRVNICPDGSLCCQSEPRCCADGQGIFLDNDGSRTDRAPSTTYSWGPGRTTDSAPLEPTTLPSATTATSTTESATSSTTELASSVTQPAPTSSSDNLHQSSNTTDSIGFKVGLGIGVPAAVLLVAGVAFWVYRRRRVVSQSESQPMPNHGRSPLSPWHLSSASKSEAPYPDYARPEQTRINDQGPVELDGSNGVAPAEMPARAT